jgi:HK97 family phage major capsid protein
MTTKELREKRVALAEKAAAILKKAHDDQREILTGDEETEWQAIHADIDRLARHIEMQERQEALAKSLEDPQARRTEPNATKDEGRDSRMAMSQLARGQADTERALRSWLLAPMPGAVLGDEDRAAAKRVGIDLGARSLTLKFSTQAMRSLAEAKEWSYRALGVGTGSAGGFTVPDEMMRGIERALLLFGGMRARTTVVRTQSGADLPWPTVNDTAQKGQIIAENATSNEQDVAFGQLVLQAFLYSSKMVKVSVQMLQDNAVNVTALLGSMLGERIGRILNEHFTTGTGSGQPRGIVTAAPTGVTAANGTSQVTTWIYGSIVDLEHSVDPAYRANAAFMMSDSSVKNTKKILDSTGRPIWMPGVSPGVSGTYPDTLLGYPIVTNQDMATMAAGAKSVAFGDLSKYLIRDVLDLQLLRLDERYAEFHQVAFLAYSRHDGDLLDAGTNPVKLFVNAAS